MNEGMKCRGREDNISVLFHFILTCFKLYAWTSAYKGGTGSRYSWSRWTFMSQQVTQCADNTALSTNLTDRWRKVAPLKCLLLAFPNQLWWFLITIITHCFNISVVGFYRLKICILFLTISYGHKISNSKSSLFIPPTL